MNTKPVDREALEAALIEALDKTLDTERESEGFGVRCFFGVGELGETSQADYRYTMGALIDAAIAHLCGEPIDIEKAAQEFLRGKLMVLTAGSDKSDRSAVKMSVRNDGYGDITYTTSASIGYGSAIPSPFIDTAIAEARRREGYDEANKPMVLIEPPKEPEVEQVAGDGSLITDEDVEAATGDDPSRNIPF